jgi:uncharacterized protein (TIGR03067 family)
VKTRLLLIPAALLAFGVSLPAAPVPDKKDDKDLIQGTWSFVSGERNGEPAPDQVKSMKLTFKDDMVTPSTEKNPAKFKLDTTKKPKEITLTITEGGQEKTIHGIYELDGDDLKICFPDKPDGPAPKEFSGKKDSGQMLMVFKRDKS